MDWPPPARHAAAHRAFLDVGRIAQIEGHPFMLRSPCAICVQTFARRGTLDIVGKPMTSPARLHALMIRA
jgi:hypothetical protein